MYSLSGADCYCAYVTVQVIEKSLKFNNGTKYSTHTHTRWRKKTTNKQTNVARMRFAQLTVGVYIFHLRNVANRLLFLPDSLV